LDDLYFDDLYFGEPMLNVSRVVGAWLLSGALVAGAALGARAEGITIFSGAKQELDYRSDFGSRHGGFDRYRLKVPKKYVKLAVLEMAIAFPEYTGKLNPKEIEVKVNDKKIKLQEIKFDKDERVVEIFPEAPIAAGSTIEIVFSDVTNPRSPGTFYFYGTYKTPGEGFQVGSFGEWIITID
jgi:Protein of unknown function (DUF2808)